MTDDIDAALAALFEPSGRAPSGDGRHARSERSRQAMVEALLGLLREGNVRPSSAQIAERAGVTQRTLFNQFGDMDSLVAAVSAHVAQRAASLLPEIVPGPLAERAATYCGGLSLLLEETMPVRWAVVTTTTGDWSGARAVTLMREFMRTRLADAFAPELDPLDGSSRDELLDALELETDPVVWRLRRVQQGLSVDEARARMERAVVALLRTA